MGDNVIQYSGKVVALGSRLIKCRNVITLGVKTDFFAYSPEERDLIIKAEKIYYPSDFYADLFDSIGKNTFPSYHTYKYAQDKIKQTALFALLNIPRPRTKIFYGKRQKEKITDHFDFPFIAKNPRGSARGMGVFLIRNKDDLINYCEKKMPAYIQKYLETDRSIRIVIIGKKIVHSYWRVASNNDFRSNVAMGAEISLSPVPGQALELARHTATRCGWDDVGIDILMHEDNFYVLEANMRYGREGFKKAGMDYSKLMEEMIRKKEI
jgi:ribosomal protein S6--L-glutamate ligase